MVSPGELLGAWTTHLVTGMCPADVRVQRNSFFLLRSREGILYPHGQRPAVHLEVHHINSFLTPQGNLEITQRSKRGAACGLHADAPLTCWPLLPPNTCVRHLYGMVWERPGFPSGPCLGGSMFCTSPTDSKGACIMETRLIFWSLMLRRVCKRSPPWVPLRSPSIPGPDTSPDSVLAFFNLRTHLWRLQNDE